MGNIFLNLHFFTSCQGTYMTVQWFLALKVSVLCTRRKKLPRCKQVQAMYWTCRLHLCIPWNACSPAQLHNLSLCFILPSFSWQIVFFSAAFYCSKRSRNLSLACLLISNQPFSDILETQKISLFYFNFFFNVPWELSIAPHLLTYL